MGRAQGFNIHRRLGLVVDGLAELCLKQVTVSTAQSQQFFVGTLFGDHAVLDYQDLICL